MGSAATQVPGTATSVAGRHGGFFADFGAERCLPSFGPIVDEKASETAFKPHLLVEAAASLPKNARENMGTPHPFPWVFGRETAVTCRLPKSTISDADF